MFSVCWKLAKGKIEKKHKTVTVIEPKYKTGTVSNWLDNNGIEDKKTVIIFKKVSHDFKTQEKTKNETIWEVGTEVIHHDWKPESGECGEGKFHACSRPYFCDEFRGEKGDRYIALEVEKKDMHAWDNPSYPNKIAFRKCKVLYQCNKLGKKI